MALPTHLELLKAYRQRAKKSLGQNFLYDGQVIDRIARAAARQHQGPLLEIGPGPGSLSSALLSYELETLAVEKDSYAVGFLREKLPTLEVIEADILDFALPEHPAQWSVVGNLPYNIATEIFFNFLTQREHIARLTFMFQREVAQRFVAVPSTKAYGVLSVIAQRFYKVRYLLTVPPEAFKPRPKIMSGVVTFTPTAEVFDSVEEVDAFRALVKTAFAQRRKVLSNCLLGFRGIDKPSLLAVLEEAEIDSRLRPENLSPDDYTRLVKIWLKATKSVS